MKYFYYLSVCVLFKLIRLETPVVAAQAEVCLHGE